MIGFFYYQSKNILLLNAMAPENRKINPKLKRTLDFLIRLLLLSAPLYHILFFGLDKQPLQAAVTGQASFIKHALNIP